jgi:hypothetical protein
MANIGDYIQLSDTAFNITEIYTSPKDFYKSFSKIYESELDSFIRHTLVNNVPFVFKSKPLLFEQITQYLADNLGINPSEIKLIGSGKTGFSISPPPNYGNLFSPRSDLDFSIISEAIFLNLKDEFESWAFQFENKILLPQNKNQEIYWPQNLDNCNKTLKRGFIDTYKIPAYNQFIRTQRIQQSLYLIKDKLQKVYNFEVEKASLRVYKNWKCFTSQLKLNTESVLNKVSKNIAF